MSRSAGGVGALLRWMNLQPPHRCWKALPQEWGARGHRVTDGVDPLNIGPGICSRGKKTLRF